MIKTDVSLLRDPSFEKFYDKTELLTFEKGELVLKSGDKCKYLFFVESGMLRTFYYDLKGNDITHWFAHEDMFITVPPSFFNGEKSFFSIEAMEPTTARVINHKHLEEAFQYSRVIERYGRLLVTQVMITMGRKIIDLHTKSAEQRYEELIENYPDIFHRANLGHIASYLGITQQSLSRIRAASR